MRIYNFLSDKEKMNVACYYNGQPWSWSVVELEVEQKTPLGKKLLGRIQ